MSLRDQIASTTGPQLTPVEMPEWNCTLYVKRLNFGERAKLVDVLTDPANKNKLMYVLGILAAVTDQDGNKVFTDEDYDLVCSKEMEPVLRLGTVAAKVNQLTAAHWLAKLPPNEADRFAGSTKPRILRVTLYRHD